MSISEMVAENLKSIRFCIAIEFNQDIDTVAVNLFGHIIRSFTVKIPIVTGQVLDAFSRIIFFLADVVAINLKFIAVVFQDR